MIVINPTEEEQQFLERFAGSALAGPTARPVGEVSKQQAVVRRETAAIRPETPVVDAPTELAAGRAIGMADTIATVIPAYNEADSISRVLEAILQQSRPPEYVYVIVNNSDDATADIAAQFIGLWRRSIRGAEYFTEVEVHDIGHQPDKKVGALNYGFRQAAHADYIMGVDGDTVLHHECIADLLAEMRSDTRIGGISAIYDVPYRKGAGPMETFLVAGQRRQFAEFEMDNLLSDGRRMAVLGGQATLFRTRALTDVCNSRRLVEPWVRDSAVEDGLLTLWIAAEGYRTVISPSARAHVDAMRTLHALHAQQVKWVAGAADLMWRNPLHPNLRLRWRETFAMVLNIATRLGFVGLLTASLSLGAWRWNPLWLVPVVLSVLLGLRVASTMKSRQWRDYLFALLAVPTELYMWIRMGHFTSAWNRHLSKSRKDAWAMQARAERGGGGFDQAYPYLVVLLLAAIATVAWRFATVGVRSDVLAVGWPILASVTVVQSLTMFRKILRRTHGYRV